MENKKDAYSKIENLIRRIYYLGRQASLAAWDEAVMMPVQAGPQRAQASAELQLTILELMSHPQVADWVNQAQSELNQSGNNSVQKANLQKFVKAWKHQVCLPAKLVEELCVKTSLCEQSWRQLRKDNNWKDFLPQLESVVSLVKESAEIKAEKLGLDVYDSLMDSHFEGLNTKTVEPLFTDLKIFLKDFLPVAKDKSQSSLDSNFKMSADKQRLLGLKIISQIGFDLKAGRLDVSTHPFCMGLAGEVRLTTRFDENDFVPGLMSCIHEAGHGMYEQNLPKNWIGQPLGKANLAIHEGQSLFYEMQIGTRREFLEMISPDLKLHLGEAGLTHSQLAEQIYRKINQVQPSLIRVDADEVSYPLHVILRYEIERDWMEGRTSVKDLPEIWNDKMSKYIGISTAGNYRDGCMQDIHWPMGLLGYFPSYSFGALVAAQTFAKQKRDRPSIVTEIQNGEFAQIKDWMKEKIWSQGSLLSTDELVKASTGKSLGTEDFKTYLKEKYLS